MEREVGTTGYTWCNSRRWRAALLALSVLAAASCGSNKETTGDGVAPTPLPSPSPTFVNINGSWRGTLTFNAGSDSGQETFAMELAQAPGNATVTGTYTGEHFVGSINGQTTSNAFTGTIDLSFDLDGMACTGSANLSGTASTSALNWTSASLAGASPCIDAPVDFALNAQR